MMTVNQKNIKPGQQDDFLRIQDLLYLCLARWKWFVLSLAVTIGAATGNTVLCAGSQFVWDSIRHCLPCAGVGLCVSQHHHAAKRNSESIPARSEERRVGKECRSRWSPYH